MTAIQKALAAIVVVSFWGSFLVLAVASLLD
jgi:hypothetical protein